MGTPTPQGLPPFPPIPDCLLPRMFGLEVTLKLFERKTSFPRTSLILNYGAFSFFTSSSPLGSINQNISEPSEPLLKAPSGSLAARGCLHLSSTVTAAETLVHH